MRDTSSVRYDPRRLYGNLVLGTIAVGAAAVLLTPKVRALLDGSLDFVGTGTVANLALLAGGILFLVEARKAYAAALRGPDEQAQLTSGDGPVIGDNASLRDRVDEVLR